MSRTSQFGSAGAGGRPGVPGSEAEGEDVDQLLSSVTSSLFLEGDDGEAAAPPRGPASSLGPRMPLERASSQPAPPGPSGRSGSAGFFAEFGVDRPGVSADSKPGRFALLGLEPDGADSYDVDADFFGNASAGEALFFPTRPAETSGKSRIVDLAGDDDAGANDSLSLDPEAGPSAASGVVSSGAGASRTSAGGGGGGGGSSGSSGTAATVVGVGSVSSGNGSGSASAASLSPATAPVLEQPPPPERRSSQVQSDLSSLAAPWPAGPTAVGGAAGAGAGAGGGAGGGGSSSGSPPGVVGSVGAAGAAGSVGPVGAAGLSPLDPFAAQGSQQGVSPGGGSGGSQSQYRSLTAASDPLPPMRAQVTPTLSYLPPRPGGPGPAPLLGSLVGGRSASAAQMGMGPPPIFAGGPPQQPPPPQSMPGGELGGGGDLPPPPGSYMSPPPPAQSRLPFGAPPFQPGQFYGMPFMTADGGAHPPPPAYLMDGHGLPGMYGPPAGPGGFDRGDADDDAGLDDDGAVGDGDGVDDGGLIGGGGEDEDEDEDDGYDDDQGGGDDGGYYDARGMMQQHGPGMLGAHGMPAYGRPMPPPHMRGGMIPMGTAGGPAGGGGGGPRSMRYDGALLGGGGGGGVGDDMGPPGPLRGAGGGLMSAAVSGGARNSGPLVGTAQQFDDRPTCNFFLQGTCRYGQYCRYKHDFGPQCPNCRAEVPQDPAQQSAHLASCEETRLVNEERKNSVNLTCGVCMDNIVASGKRFGLLNACRHAFCLPCIREWRGSIDQRKENARSCPLCREESYFVVPCDRMVVDQARKERVIEQYKEKLGRIACMHFNRSKGTCPFGSSCFYAHIDEHGNMVEPERLRVRSNADGEVEVVQGVRLADFLFPT